MTDQNRKIILNPLLNFVTRSMLDGAKIDLIIGKAVSFFDHGTIISAKEFLYIQSRYVADLFRADLNIQPRAEYSEPMCEKCKG